MGCGQRVLAARQPVEQTLSPLSSAACAPLHSLRFPIICRPSSPMSFPASLPMAEPLFLDGWTVHGDMMVVFAAAITLAAYNSSRGFVNGLRLNCDLIERTQSRPPLTNGCKRKSSQRKSSKDQLRQAHKMEAIGQLTGGIAHDFNNLLTVVSGISRSRITASARIRAPSRYCRSALRAAERGAALTRHLLAFARRQRLDPRPVDIPALIAARRRS